MNKQNEGWTKVAALNVKVPSGAIRDWERLLVICSLSTVRCLLGIGTSVIHSIPQADASQMSFNNKILKRSAFHFQFSHFAPSRHTLSLPLHSLFCSGIALA
jgi:hypothetical protein